ncbi:hypothetical protein PGT21_020567 [Puccinia graminis f. sp. tritici]|uniref:Uncharacterized protein n=1 Tax=Puccinia graminis f. sp. tritici TaxID=56615 RepID=A0A5B0PII5_PUCGR|nr:hypothetical protein PGT21_020567 [Puccinia graminis f. sp. tritici]
MCDATVWGMVINSVKVVVSEEDQEGFGEFLECHSRTHQFINMYSQQSYGVLHHANPHPSGYPGDPSAYMTQVQNHSSAAPWGPQHQQQQMIPSSAGPVSDPTLPAGWIKQWNQQYQAWFFVNTFAQPPLSQWIHPGPVLPPAGPPPMAYGNYPARNPNGPAPTGAYQSTTQQANNGAAGTQGYNGSAAPATKQLTATNNAGANKSNSAASRIMAAGMGAMGGLALGGLINHEWKEHQHREHKRENEAYASGYQQGESQREYDHNNNNNISYQEVDDSDQSWSNQDSTPDDDEDGDW